MIDVFIRQIFLYLHTALRNLQDFLAAFNPFSLIPSNTPEWILSPFAVDLFSHNSDFEYSNAEEADSTFCPATMPTISLYSHSWQQLMQQTISEAIMPKGDVSYNPNRELLIK